MLSSTSSVPRVVLADDDALIRYTTHRILRDACEVVGEAADGEAAVALARDLQPDVVVLDISMPGMSGFAAARAIRDRQPGIRVIMLSSHTAPSYIDEAFRNGAHGYVVKETAGAQLADAIQETLQGHMVRPE